MHIENPHPHLEIIIAKAKDQTLVKFEKQGKPYAWKISVVQSGANATHADPNYEYFLCLPQYADVCLPWLNGAEVEDNYSGKWTPIEAHVWHGQSPFMWDDNFDIRLKPKMVDKWICYNDGRLGVHSFDTEDECIDHYQDGATPLQYIKIQVVDSKE